MFDTKGDDAVRIALKARMRMCHAAESVSVTACGDSSDFERAVQLAVAAWVNENWREIQEGAMPELPELSQTIRFLACRHLGLHR